MLSQVMDLVKGYAQKAVDNNPQIPAEEKESVANTATDAMKDGLLSNLSGLTSLFSGNAGSNSNSSTPGGSSFVTMLEQKVSGELTRRAGIESGLATVIASSLVPMVIKAISNKVSSGEFNVGSLLTSVEGEAEKDGGLFGKIGNLFGKH